MHHLDRRCLTCQRAYRTSPQMRIDMEKSNNFWLEALSRRAVVHGLHLCLKKSSMNADPTDRSTRKVLELDVSYQGIHRISTLMLMASQGDLKWLCTAKACSGHLLAQSKLL
ncbi:hypothetical protein MHYP_G00186180 [Metynnis hypsauchen]